MGRKTRESFDSVDEAISEIVKGRIVIVTDDASRENEGDLVMAAAKARHQRKKHNRWLKNQEAWRAQQKLIEKKERPPKAVAAPKVVELPPGGADALPAAGNVRFTATTTTRCSQYRRGS